MRHCRSGQSLAILFARADVIETAADGRVGNSLHRRPRLQTLSGGPRRHGGLDEFVCDPNGDLFSPVSGVTRGTFDFIVRPGAKSGCLRIEHAGGKHSGPR